MTIPTVEISAALLTMLGGTLLSLFANYWPGFAEKFATKSSTEKRLWMLGALVVVSLIIVALSATGVWVLVPMTKEGILFLVFNFGLSVIANQSTYNISPEKAKITQLKQSRNQSSYKSS